MQFKQKILLLIVLSVLPAIVAFSVTSFYVIEKDVTKSEIEFLDAIASSKESHVEDSIERNLERLKGITSRTQLRNSIDSFNTNFEIEDKILIEKIITDAKNSISDFKDIVVLNPQGDVIASTNYEYEKESFSNSNMFMSAQTSEFIDITLGPNGEECLLLAGAFYLDEKFIGIAVVLSDPKSIMEITSDYSTLGNTGETFLAKRTDSGDALFITPLRFQPDSTLKTIIPKESTDIPIIQALMKNENTFTNTVDYRGEDVLSSTRYLENTDWGLVVKIDKNEAYSSVVELKKLTSFTIILSLTIAGIFSIIISRKFTNPLDDLKEATKSIADGKYDLQINSPKDELGEFFDDFKKMAKSLKKSRKELRHLKEIDESKESFLSMVTHELKTPLTPIMGWCEALKEPNMLGELNTKQKNAVDSIFSNSSKLKGLIEDVLDVQKLDLKKLKIVYTKFLIKEFLNSIREDAEKITGKKQIEILIDCDDKLELVSDIRRVHQVFTNLVNNAIDFVPEDTGKIILKAIEDKNKIIFSVEDNGTGIPDEKQADLFKKFYQIDTSVTRNHGGTGLGLAICKGVVELLGGKIWVESHEGKGSIFYFSIPQGNMEKSK